MRGIFFGFKFPFPILQVVMIEVAKFTDSINVFPQQTHQINLLIHHFEASLCRIKLYFLLIKSIHFFLLFMDAPLIVLRCHVKFAVETIEFFIFILFIEKNSVILGIDSSTGLKLNSFELKVTSIQLLKIFF